MPEFEVYLTAEVTGKTVVDADNEEDAQAEAEYLDESDVDWEFLKVDVVKVEQK